MIEVRQAITGTLIGRMRDRNGIVRERQIVSLSRRSAMVPVGDYVATMSRYAWTMGERRVYPEYAGNGEYAVRIA